MAGNVERVASSQILITKSNLIITKNQFTMLRKLSTALLMGLFIVLSINTYAQSARISGTVVDKSGVPVIGAAVLQSGTTNGAATDLDGAFSISVPKGTTVEVSFIGYLTKTFVVSDQTTYNVVLEEDTQMLEETVVIGYGVQKKSDVTGAIASVKSDDLQNRSITDAASALQGKAAGVQILNTSGAPGQSATIQIRGYSSNSKTSPLIIVDGLKVPNMGYLDPENIASMEILKDGASAAIYGVEAGNGVVLITTKSGSASKGAGKVFYNFQYSTQEASNLPNILNSEEYEKWTITGAAATQAEFDLYWDGKTSTYWPDYTFEKGRIQRHTIGFQGGNDRGSLYVSMNYLDNDGMVKGDRDTQKRLTAQINADYKIKDWLQVGVNTSIENGQTRTVTESSTGGSFFLSNFLIAPITPYIYDNDNIPGWVQTRINAGWNLPKDADGNIYGIPAFGGLSHPMVQIEKTTPITKSFNMRGTAFANLTPIDGLTITSRFGYSAGFNDTQTYNYKFKVAGDAEQDFSLNGRMNTNLYYQWENFANYVFNVGKSTFTTMAGMSFQKTMTNTVNATAYALSSYAENYRYLDNAVNTTNMSMSGAPSETANMSYYARLGWAYDNRYNVQASFRADAYDTTKLDKTARWGYFPSVSAGWTISNEEFMSGIDKSLLSSLRLRASWGINGNVNALSSYQYASALSIQENQGYNFDDGQGFILGIGPKNTARWGRTVVLANPTLKWETSDQVDLGLEARMFNDKLSLNIDWYNKNTNDLLTTTTAPATTGSTSMYVNAGKVNNTGIDFEVSWKEQVGDFGYGISANASTLKNVVVEGTSKEPVPGANGWSSTPMTYFEAGYPLWYIRGYRMLSVDPQTGAATYKDFNNDGAITQSDREYVGSGIPRLTYGLTLNFEYKNFDLIISGAGAQGVDRYYGINRADAKANNTTKFFYDNSWWAPGDNAKYPKHDTADNVFFCSDQAVFDASFFKVKQIQLGYNFSKSLLDKINMSDLRLYVSLDDFFTFTNYPGLDPETNGYYGSANSIGMDFGSYPISKKIVFGVNVAF